MPSTIDTPTCTCAELIAADPDGIERYRRQLEQLTDGPAIVTTGDGRRLRLADDYTGIHASPSHALALLSDPGPLPPHLGRGYRSHHYNGFPVEHLRRQADRCRLLDADASGDSTQLAGWLLTISPLDQWAIAVTIAIAAAPRFAGNRPLLITAAAIDDLVAGNETETPALSAAGLAQDEADTVSRWVEMAARHSGAERIAYAALK